MNTADPPAAELAPPAPMIAYLEHPAQMAAWIQGAAWQRDHDAEAARRLRAVDAERRARRNALNAVHRESAACWRSLARAGAISTAAAVLVALWALGVIR